MSSVIETKEQEIGNPARVVQELTETLAEQRDRLSRRADEQAGDTGRGQATTFEEPERFKGKSREDILRSYVNLESLQGRTARELGQSRQQLNQFAQQRQTIVQKPVEVSASDLLEKPTETLSKFLESATAKLQADANERVFQLEQQLQEQQFLSKHGDYQEVLQGQGFSQWASKTPYRQNLAAQAAQGNWQAADAILTEYKDYAPVQQRQAVERQSLQTARSVALEGSGGNEAQGRTTGKTYRAADLMRLRVTDPETYEREDFQAEVLKAYREGRVIR